MAEAESTPAPVILSAQTAVALVVLLLTVIGLIAIYAASSLKGAQQFGDEYLFLRKQGVAAIVGFLTFFVLQRLPMSWIEHLAMPLMGVTLLLLSLIFIPGVYTKIGGASRWLNLPFIGGQPSELTKLAMVLFLARNLSRPKSDMNSLSAGVLPNLAVFGLLAGLLLMQKDLGTPVLLFAVTFAMMFAAGLSRRFIFGGIALAASAVFGAVLIEPYRIQRILSFIDPWSQVKGRGFQIIQSFVAFQNGGLFGAGLGESKQKLFFLPEAHTDFILAVIGEELGLVGVLVVCACFVYLTLVGFHISRCQQGAYRRFLAFGLTATIAVQACINMGVCMGLLPTKGMTLPLVSSGNSSLLVFLVISAILARLAKESAKASEVLIKHAGEGSS